MEFFLAGENWRTIGNSNLHESLQEGQKKLMAAGGLSDEKKKKKKKKN